MVRAIFLVVVVSLSLASAARADDSNVTNAVELMQAVRAAQGGERIVLGPGDYGRLDLSDTGAKWRAAVTLAAKRDAVLHGLGLDHVSNLVLDGLRFDYVFMPGDSILASPFAIRRGDHIVIRNAVFAGDNASGTRSPADGYGTAKGLSVSQSSAIVIERNVFHTWHRAALFRACRQLTVSGNDVFDDRSEGFNLADVQDVLVENNHIHDFRKSEASGDHPDMIQVWTNGTHEPTVNLTIRNNVLDQGAGGWTQSIFMRNEEVDQGRAGAEMFYRNVTIEGNVIRNSQIHGITVGASDGLRILNNTLIEAAPALGQRRAWRPAIGIAAQSRHVSVSGNIVPKLRWNPDTAAADWITSGNVMVQREDPARPNHVREIFLDAERPGGATLADLRVLPDSAAAKLGAGSPQSRFDTAPMLTDGYILNRAVGADDRRQQFDASHVFGPQGRIDMAAASVTWDFGDGTQAEGVLAQHVYAAAQDYEVTATLLLADAARLVLRRHVVIAAPGR